MMTKKKVNNIEVHVFHGDFCRPCREALPIIQGIQKEFESKYSNSIKFIYHKFESENNGFDIYNITNVPTIILKQSLKTKSKCIHRWIGMPTVEDFNVTLEDFMTKSKIEEINIKSE